MPKKQSQKSSLRDSILADQKAARTPPHATEQLTGELGEACQAARELYRENRAAIRSVKRLHQWLIDNHGYPYGKDAFTAFLEAK